MKDLPEKFQFRHKLNKGFTHYCKLNSYGDYEVTWARGWAEVIRRVPWRVISAWEVKNAVAEGDWTVVDDVPKQEELPDQFTVQHHDSHNKYVLKKKSDDVWNIYEYGGVAEANPNYPYTSEQMTKYLKCSTWKIINKPALTAEQQRQLKEFREQIAQLDSSIRINEQTIEHHQRMIGNYKQRQNDLLEKIADITGEDSPSVVKAKEMKAELAKLKKGNV